MDKLFKEAEKQKQIMLAASDLLEACKKARIVLSYLSRRDLKGDDQAQLGPLLDELDKAIQKATE